MHLSSKSLLPEVKNIIINSKRNEGTENNNFDVKLLKKLTFLIINVLTISPS